MTASSSVQTGNQGMHCIPVQYMALHLKDFTHKFGLDSRKGEDLRMWLKNACVIKKIPINNAAAAGSDPNVAEFIEKATQTLGKKGRFVIKLSGIPQENSVLAEGKSERLCNHCIEEFEKLLIKKGYMDHEHVWEILQETDYGEMDYNSCGGGVERFVVTLYRCRLCNALHKECRGDLMGDPEEYLEITDDDIAAAER